MSMLIQPEHRILLSEQLIPVVDADSIRRARRKGGIPVQRSLPAAGLR